MTNDRGSHNAPASGKGSLELVEDAAVDATILTEEDVSEMKSDSCEKLLIQSIGPQHQKKDGHPSPDHVDLDILSTGL